MVCGLLSLLHVPGKKHRGHPCSRDQSDAASSKIVACWVVFGIEMAKPDEIAQLQSQGPMVECEHLPSTSPVFR